MIDVAPIQAPGLYPEVPFEDYLRWPLLSQSTLKAGQDSMAHLKAAIDGMRTVKVTDDMLLGSALHVTFLEPELAATRVVKWEGERRAGKEWEAFKAEHAGKIILTDGNYTKLVGMVRSLRRHPEVKRWQNRIEHVELSAVGDIGGVRFKGRCDALTPDPLVDLKKVSSGDLGNFTRTVLNFGYHMQAFIYSRLFKRDRFMFITVEDAPPYDVVPYELSPAFIRHGEREVNVLIARYKWCSERNEWPGRSDDVIQLEIPEWAVPADEADAITIDGAPGFMEQSDA